MKPINKSILFVISTLWLTGVNAEVEMLDENASTEQIREAFTGKSHGLPIGNTQEKIKTRSIPSNFSLEEQNLQTPEKAAKRKYYKKKQYGAGVATAIQFKYNSTELLAGSQKFIKKLGQVLAETDGKFVIEGHTDASGTKSHNLELSEKRAKIIKQILIAEHNINPERILIKGKGETALRFSPHNYKNRRVEIIPIKDN